MTIAVFKCRSRQSSFRRKPESRPIRSWIPDLTGCCQRVQNDE
jgi:hypothetical protein